MYHAILNEECVKNLIRNSVIAIAEGANMPITLGGVNLISESNTLYAPGKAANAGGVSVSALEMSQNSMRLKWSFEEVDSRLKVIMTDIFENISTVSETYGFPRNYLAGANMAGFKTVADSMIAQGVV
jgi:glutamate dehydrogenase (NADP+)